MNKKKRKAVTLKPEDIQALIEALKDENKYVRINAARALGKIGDAMAVPALNEAIKDENKYVRINAAKALGKIGGSQK